MQSPRIGLLLKHLYETVVSHLFVYASEGCSIEIILSESFSTKMNSFYYPRNNNVSSTNRQKPHTTQTILFRKLTGNVRLVATRLRPRHNFRRRQIPWLLKNFARGISATTEHALLQPFPHYTYYQYWWCSYIDHRDLSTSFASHSELIITFSC